MFDCRTSSDLIKIQKKKTKKKLFAYVYTLCIQFISKVWINKTFSIQFYYLLNAYLYHGLLRDTKTIELNWLLKIELFFFFFQKIAIIQWWNLLLTLDHKSVFINYLKLLYNDGGDEKIIKLIFNDIFEIKEFINSIKWIAYSIMIGK